MSSRSIFLISNNELLYSLCRTEIPDEFEFCMVNKESFKKYLVAETKPGCVLLDYYYESEIEVYAMYKFLSAETCFPVIIIVSSRKTMGREKRNLFANAQFVSIFAPSGFLGKAIENALNPAGNKSIAFVNCPSSMMVDDEIRPFDIFCGDSHLMQNFRKQVIKAALTDDIVLLVGESGCGKSYTAKFIHSQSKRANQKIEEYNAAELTDTIAESQLFGTEAGAYTDARERNGLFSMAKDGTLFLDEIGELPMELQAKLLRVIEEHKYRRVGSMEERPVTSRFIFATNVDLKKRVLQHKFREDLFYRIDVLRIRVPALREHIEDLPRLVQNFVIAKKKSITEPAMQRLMSYQWPGNIRELQNVLNRACTFCKEDVIELDDITFYD